MSSHFIVYTSCKNKKFMHIYICTHLCIIKMKVVKINIVECNISFPFRTKIDLAPNKFHWADSVWEINITSLRNIVKSIIKDIWLLLGGHLKVTLYICSSLFYKFGVRRNLRPSSNFFLYCLYLNEEILFNFSAYNED